MSQNLYDDPAYPAGYSQVPRQVHGLAGAPEWPTVRAMLPAIAGRRVVDLGRGFGWASRWFREQGARAVLGLERLGRGARAADDPGGVGASDDGLTSSHGFC